MLGLTPCRLPLQESELLQSRSLFYVTLHCHKHLEAGDFALQCSPHTVHDIVPAVDPALIVRKVDIFITDEHAAPPTIKLETRYDAVFCNGMFQLVNTLGLKDKG